METLKRVAYALASFDKETQKHQVYDERKGLLDASCENIRKHLKEHDTGSKIIASSALYSKEKNISVCVYKNHVFVGFQDKATKQISLNDMSNSFVNMPSISPEKLEERIKNAITDAELGRNNNMNNELQPCWKELVPVMDKLLAYENELQKLPVYARESMERQGKIDETIDKIIGEFAPDKNVKQPPSKNTKTVEDNPKRNICEIPLSERFSTATTSAEAQKKEQLDKTIDSKEKQIDDISKDD